MTEFNKKIAITTGDVNGIGAEITIKAINRLNLSKKNVVIISNKEVLDFYGGLDGYKIAEIDFDKKNILPSRITAESGEFSFKSLKKACEMVKAGKIEAIVTAPVAKEALYLAGHKFNGQTEILQEFLSKEGQHAEMLFLADDFRVLLLTRHLALKDISLNKEEIVEKISSLNEFFKSKLKISSPKFALCALNPHAGENGILGREENEILIPATEILKKMGIDITNPLPADTLFITAGKAFKNKTKSPYDCYIATYHDQGLIPIKMLASEKTVNMTIGLDIIRTSPSHGTAFDIAGQNIANEESMIQAILEALK